MAKRHTNRGLAKICACGRAKWAKCKHSWHFAYKWKGTHYRFSLDKELDRHIDSKTAAEAEAETLRTKIRGGTFRVPLPARDTLTLAQLLDTYDREVLTGRATAANDRYQMATIARTPLRLPTGEVRAFGDWLVQDVTAAALLQYMAARQVPQTTAPTGRGARRVGGPVAARRNLALLRAVFYWALGLDYIATNPFHKNGRPAVRGIGKKTERARRLHGDEGARLLAACGPHLRAVVECGLETGMRRGEILGLRWRDVALDVGEIRLPAGATKTKTARTIPISARLRAVLDMRRVDPAGEPLPPTAFVFGTEIGSRVASITTAWRAACGRAGIADLHFHDLRREAGSRWLDAGVPLHTVQAWLGHANISQTSTYLATTARAAHDAMRRFDERRGSLQDLATEDGSRHHDGARLDKMPRKNPRQNTIGHGAH